MKHLNRFLALAQIGLRGPDPHVDSCSPAAEASDARVRLLEGGRRDRHVRVLPPGKRLRAALYRRPWARNITIEIGEGCDQRAGVGAGL